MRAARARSPPVPSAESPRSCRQGGEWPVLESLLSDPTARARLGSGTLVRQLLLEIHLIPDAEEYARFVAAPGPQPWTWRSFLKSFGVAQPVPPYPLPSTEAALAANEHALRMLHSLASLGFALFSFRYG
jgi:hypothetical protein